VKVALESEAAAEGRLTDNMSKKIIKVAKDNFIVMSIASFMAFSPYQQYSQSSNREQSECFPVMPPEAGIQ